MKKETQGSTIAVFSAVAGNSIVMCVKFIAYFMTGSSALLSEAIHSFADVTNQSMLAVGIIRSKKKADKDHPYGYSREVYIWAIISAVGVFFLGCGVTLAHGVQTLLRPTEIHSLHIGIWVLWFSLIVEGITLLVAVKATKKDAKKNGQTFWQYLKSTHDPMGLAVVLEDSAAVLGVIIALVATWLTKTTGEPYWDSLATISIGVILGFVAISLIIRTRKMLIGASMYPEKKAAVMKILREDPIVERVYDVKTLVLGINDVRFKAEVEFNGEQLSENHMEKTNLSRTLDRIKDENSLKTFLISHGNSLIEYLGDEVDRIEKNIKKTVPEVKHIDIEAN